MKRKTMLAIFTAAFTGLLLFTGCKETPFYTVTYIRDIDGYIIRTDYVESGNRTTPPSMDDGDIWSYNGWYTDDGSLFDFDTPITRDITLTVHCDMQVYAVRFVCDERAIDKAMWRDYVYESPSCYVTYVEAGDTIPEPPEPKPFKDNLSFFGWSRQSESDGSFVQFGFDSNQYPDKLYHDETIYAGWAISYTVRFLIDYGVVDIQELVYSSHGTYTEKDVYASAPELSDDIIRRYFGEDYVFAGWYTEDGSLFDFDTPITGDITLTARREPIYNDGRPAGSKDLTTNESLNGTWKLTDGYGYENHPLYGLEEYKTMDALAEMFNGMVYDYYHDSNSKHDKSWSFFDANFCRTITSVEAKGLFTYLKNQIAAMQSYGDGWIVINNAETRIDIFLHGESGLIYNDNYVGNIIQEIQFTLEKQ